MYSGDTLQGANYGGYQPNQVNYGGGYQAGYAGNMNIAGNMNMAAFGNFPLGGAFNGTYLYNGSPIQFQTRMQELTDADLHSLKDANISLQGIQETEAGACCLICTLIWGSILIFPLCFMCCDWWKNIVNPSFNVPVQSYSALGSLLRSANITHLNLVVVDNYFDASKAQALLAVIQHSSLKSFTFINNSVETDRRNRESSDFRKNMAPFKQLGIVCEMRWGLTLA